MFDIIIFVLIVLSISMAQKTFSLGILRMSLLLKCACASGRGPSWISTATPTLTELPGKQ